MRTLLCFSFLLFLFSCNEAEKKHFSLAIYNVCIFDVDSGKTGTPQNIFIAGDTIAEITDTSVHYSADKTLSFHGNLITPGFIDTHIHLTDVLGDCENAPDSIAQDSVSAYKNKIAETYLPYGVTTIKEVGTREKWLDKTLNWQKNPSPDFPDFFTCGGALISDEDRVPYIGHVEVKDSADAARKVQEYYDRGIRYLKLYSRLRTPEFKAVMKKATELHMIACGHLEYNVPIDSGLAFGLRHFEHLLTLKSTILHSNEDYWEFKTPFDSAFQLKSFIPEVLGSFGYIHSNPRLDSMMRNLITKMADDQATLSTTIHVLGSYTGRTYFRTFIQTRLHTEDSIEPLSIVQRAKLNAYFDVMMSYLKFAHDKGVSIVIGTDCMDGGKSMLSEFLLLSEAGFSVSDILKIATINGARSMEIDDHCGSITPGKKANLVIFSKNPFDDSRYFLSDKTVIKDGVVFSEQAVK